MQAQAEEILRAKNPRVDQETTRLRSDLSLFFYPVGVAFQCAMVVAFLFVVACVGACRIPRYPGAFPPDRYRLLIAGHHRRRRQRLLRLPS
jgi:hypothetical protein